MTETSPNQLWQSALNEATHLATSFAEGGLNMIGSAGPDDGSALVLMIAGKDQVDLFRPFMEQFAAKLAELQAERTEASATMGGATARLVAEDEE